MSETTETRTETADGGYVVVRTTETRRGNFLRVDETREERLPNGKMLRSSGQYLRPVTEDPPPQAPAPDPSQDATPNEAL